jgi:predicted thioesterase
MKPTLVPGLAFTRRVAIDPQRTIDFMGEEARVYATPALVRDIEMTCREDLLAHVDANEDSVGARIELDHLAPTLLGMNVEIRASLTEVKGRLLTFEVAVRDDLEEVARGKHVRFVVDKGKSAERLRAKRAKVTTP